MQKYIFVYIPNQKSNCLDEYRKKISLPELQEDPIEIIKTMRSSSPPPSSTDILNGQKRSARQKRVGFRCFFNKKIRLASNFLILRG